MDWRSIGAVDGNVECDLATHVVSVESAAPEATLIQAMKSAGYDAAPRN